MLPFMGAYFTMPMPGINIALCLAALSNLNNFQLCLSHARSAHDRAAQCRVRLQQEILFHSTILFFVVVVQNARHEQARKTRGREQICEFGGMAQGNWFLLLCHSICFTFSYSILFSPVPAESPLPADFTALLLCLDFIAFSTSIQHLVLRSGGYVLGH